MTDMVLDDKISKEAYDKKYMEFTEKLKSAEEERKILSRDAMNRKNVQERMQTIRVKLKSADVLDEFDRILFESIVEKVIVGEKAEDGTVDPYKLTFVLKGMDSACVSDAKRKYKDKMKAGR